MGRARGARGTDVAGPGARLPPRPALSADAGLGRAGQTTPGCRADRPECGRARGCVEAAAASLGAGGDSLSYEPAELGAPEPRQQAAAPEVPCSGALGEWVISPQRL